MKRGYEGGREQVGSSSAAMQPGLGPGKRTLTEAIDFSAARVVQRKAEVDPDHGHEHDEERAEGATAEEGMRFGDEAVLHDIAAGKKVLGVGDKGKAVLRVQEALHDLRYLVSVHGVFTADTEAVVKQFQKTQKLGETGKVDAVTYKALETVFASKKPYAEMAK